jgi:hypothetical protein
VIVAIHAGDSGTPAPVPAGRIRRIPQSPGAALSQLEASISAPSSTAAGRKRAEYGH